MQTDTRQVRIILAKTFGGNHNDPKIVECADKIYFELTGKENPKRDPVAGWLGMSRENEEIMQEVTAILHDFERGLKRSDDLAGKTDWQDFARKFVRGRAMVGEDYKTWISWFSSDPERMEWAWKQTPQTIKARWLMAFESNGMNPLGLSI